MARSTIIGIAGSLRTDSFNRSLLHAAREVAPDDMQLVIETLAGIPLYDGDVEKSSGLPERVIELKAAIEHADGLLIASPEYNNSMPGVLKNAIDWCSRPPKDIGRVFGNKPVALIGATPGRGGTRLAQSAWLPVFRTLGMRFWSGGSLYVGGASEAFVDGALKDAKIRELLEKLLTDFGSFIRS